MQEYCEYDGEETKVKPYAALEPEIDPETGDDMICAGCKSAHPGCDMCCAICQTPCSQGRECVKSNVKPGMYHERYGQDFLGEDYMPPLDTEEAEELSRLEEVIETNIKAFIAVGNALKKIQADYLYRMEYATFEEYCAERWDMGRSYAYRHIAAADVCRNLLTNCQQTEEGPAKIDKLLPKNESQVRPLLALEPDEQTAAYRMAMEDAMRNNKGRMTAKIVNRAVEQIRPPKIKRKPEPVCSEFMARQATSWIALIEQELTSGSTNPEGVRSVLNQIKTYLRKLEKAQPQAG